MQDNSRRLKFSESASGVLRAKSKGYLDKEERANLKKLIDDWNEFGQNPYWLVELVD